MSGLESELRAAFAEATALLAPSPDLTGRVRRNVRRRRSSVAVGTTLIAAIVSFAFVVTSHPKNSQPSLPSLTGSPSPTGQPAPTADRAGPQVRIPLVKGDGLGPVAVSGSTVYAALSTANGNQLNAYDRATAQLRSSVGLPARQAALAVGADGSVWLSFFPDQKGGPSGIWRLSPDLQKRSTLRLDTPERPWAAFAVLPTTGDEAVLATDHGLATVSLPAPGRAGLSTGKLRLDSAVPQGATPTDLAAFGHDVAVFEHPEISTLNPRIGIDGKPGLVYDVGPAGHINSMAASWVGLWVITNSTADQRGTLLRLDDQLRVTAPGPIVDDPALGEPQTVMASQRTIWLTTSGGHDRFVCFAFDNDKVAKGTIPADPAGKLLAVTPDEVFVAETSGISGYPVPAVCR
ncbi:MAG: hypothetical protein QOG52_482 [Frankiaceae bacterium]|nr:hypothetical protein [Frankiaceae bacterium]